MRALITLLLCALLQACGGSPASPVVTVEINTDSICSGVGIQTTCAQMLPSDWVVDDRAISGLTLHSLYTGYSVVWVGGPLGKNGIQKPFDQTAHPSQYVVVEQGGNDAYGNYPAERYELELRAILLHIISIGKTPVVTGIVPFKAGTPGFDSEKVARCLVLNSIVHRVASELGVPDVRWDLVPFDPATDTVDGIHRTEPALRKLVGKLVTTIQQN